MGETFVVDQMFHVFKQDGKAYVKRIESYLDKTQILDDLDVKASDLLQSNGIIWVEGPSDIVMDSDKRSSRAHLNDTKKRIISEFDALDMGVWVTKGKEIENYIPRSAIETALGIDINRQCGQFDLFPDYIAQYYPGFTGKKVRFASKIAKYMSCENMNGMLDVKKQIQEIGAHIEAWNR